MARLVVPPVILPGDTLEAIVLRATSLNALARPQWILSAAGLPETYATVPCDLSGLADLFGVSVRVLSSTACWPIDGKMPYAGRSLAPRTLGRALGRICPDCVSEGRDFDPTWDIRTSVACTRHGSLLRDVCPTCGRRIGAVRRGPGICRCRSSLTRQTVEADVDAMAMSSLVRKAFDGDVAPGLDAIVAIAWFVGGIAMGGRSAMISDPGSADRVAIVREGLRAVRDWPHGFSEWLIETHRPVEGRTGLADGWPLIARLRAVLPRDARETVLGAAGEALAASGLAVPPRRGTRFAGAFADDRSIDAARRLGVSSTRIAGLVEAGLLPGRIQRGGRRRFVAVPPDAAEDLAGRLERAHDARSLGSLLGVTAASASALMSHGILASVRGLGARSGTRLVEEQALAELEGGLSTVARTDRTPADALPLSEFVRTRAAPLARLLVIVLDGEVGTFALRSDGPLLGRYACSWAEVAERMRSGVGVREAARRLRVPSRAVPHLLAAGCLRRGGTSRRTGIEVGSIERFPMSYATGGTIARRLRTSGRAVGERLVAAGVRPVVSSDSRLGIPSVWRLSDAMEALERQTRNVPVGHVHRVGQ